MKADDRTEGMKHAVCLEPSGSGKEKKMKEKKKVFISYISEEHDTALQVRSALENNDIKCWMAPESIPAGMDYAEVIQDAIEKCDVFVLLLSEKSQQSKWVRKELDKALDFDKVILPFHIDNSTLIRAFDYRLTDVQRIEAFGNSSKAIKYLIDRVQTIAAKEL